MIFKTNKNGITIGGKTVDEISEDFDKLSNYISEKASKISSDLSAIQDKINSKNTPSTWSYDELPDSNISNLDKENYSIADKIREQNEYNELLKNENSSIETAIELSKRRAKNYDETLPKITEINNEYEKQHQLELEDKYNSTIKERNNEYDKYLSNLNTEVEESKKVQDSLENISPDTLEELGYKQKGYLKEIREEQHQFSDALTRIDTASVESLLPKKEDVKGYYDELLAEQREFQSQLDAIETTPIDSLKRDQYSEILSEQADGQMTLNLSATEYNDTLSTQNDLSNQRVLTLSEETDGQMALVMAENEGVSAKQKDIAETTSQIAAKEALIEASNKELLSNVNEKLAKTGVTSVTEELTIAKLREVAASNEEGSALAKETLEMLGLGEASKATSIALKGLAMVGNMIAAWAIAEVLQLAIKGLDELANSVDNCKERVDSLMSSYQTALDTANSNASRVEELASDYEKLSKGVNNLGENVSLTSEEYEQYNSLVSEIADMFPTLIQGYNDQGTAILNLKGNVEGLRDAYKEAQTEAYNTLIASGENGDGNDIIKQWEDVHDPGFFAGLFDFGAADVGGQISVSDALSQLEEIQKLTAEEYRNIENIVAGGSHKEIKSLTDIQKEIGYGSYIGKALGIDGNVTDKEFEEAKKQAKVLVQTYNAEIESALSDVETLANAYLMTNDDYSKLTDSSKTAASLLVNNLTEDIASDFSSKEDVGSWVDSVVSKLQNNPTLSNAINGLFTTDLSNMSVDEAKAVVDQYINTIAKILEEDPVDVKVRLGFDDYNDDDIAPLKTKVQGFLKDEFDDKVGELSLDDLQIASKLEIPDGTLLSWDELKQKIEEAKNATSEDSFEIPDAETLKQQISDLNSAIDSIQSAYDTLNSAIEEYNTNGGTLSIDTIQSLLSLSDEYLACLQVENGQLSLNADAMAQLAQAKLDDAQATAVTQAMTELQTIANGEAAQSTTNYITGNAALMSSLAQLSGSYEGVAKAAMTAAQAQRMSALISDAAGKDKTATENVMKGLDTKLKLIQTTKASINAGNFGKVAGKSSSSSKGSGSGKSASDTAKEEIEAYMEYLEKALEGGRITYSDYVRDVTLKLDDMYHNGRITAKEYFDYVEKRLNQQLEVYKSVLSAVTDLLEDEAQKWQDKIDALNDENDLLEKQKDDYDSILSAVDQVYQDEIDRLNEQKDLLQDKIDAINDENDALELQRKKQEALIALDKARQQRNVKIYTEDRGYFYSIDQDAYKDAQQNLQDIKNEEVIKKLEDEQDTLDDSIELLEKYRDLWNDIADAYKKKTNEALAVALWGENYEKLILQNRTQDIEAFKDKYLEIQSKIDDNKSLIDSYQEKVDYYNKLKEQWNEISSAYEKEQQRMYAAQILGANWEKDVLNGRLDVLSQFRDQYLEIQRQMTQAALDGARARNDAAASGGTGGSGGSSGGGGGSTPIQNQQAYHVLHLVGGYSTSGEASSKISSFNGKGVYKYKDGKWYVYKEEDYSNLSFGSKSEADDYIKKHLSPAGRFLVKYYHNGLENGLVDFSKKDSNFDLVQKYGLKKYEVPAILKQGEAVMNQEQIKNLGEALRTIPTAATLYTTPDYTKMLSSLKTNNTPVMVTQSVNITLPNVTNNSGYENLTRELNRLKLDAYQFANRRN